MRQMPPRKSRSRPTLGSASKRPPGILEDMEVVILDQGRLPKHRSDRVIVGLAAIDVEGLERDPKPLKSLQKRLDTLLITLIDRLSGQNPPMLILHHQHTVMQAARKEFVQVASVMGACLCKRSMISSPLGRWAATSLTQRCKEDFETA